MRNSFLAICRLAGRAPKTNQAKSLACLLLAAPGGGYHPAAPGSPRAAFVANGPGIEVRNQAGFAAPAGPTHFVASHGRGRAQPSAGARTTSFDGGWRFAKDGKVPAEAPGFDDSGWRLLDLPHDWSIEDLPRQQPDSTLGPFTKASVGKGATGYTVGGTAWYRKHFATRADAQDKLVSIQFDGVYRTADVWINGQHLGRHPHGYTAFQYELTRYLKPAGQQNVVAVRVQNEGKNSRWYSGSGIYRHVWLTVTNRVHVVPDGVYVTTPAVSAQAASVQVRTSLRNEQPTRRTVTLVTTLLAPDGKAVGQAKKSVVLEANAALEDAQLIAVKRPALWALETPRLYRAVTEIKDGTQVIDQVETPFGIRSLHFDGATGFTLNGKRVILKGGCIHHDNGPLGAAAIDRAEERKVELLKKQGYNALRSSHNPASKELLDACDRLGVLMVDEAFDMWEKAKSPQDYHLDFKEWWQKDLQAMLMRDRNHPSIIMWSIGNEIYEAPDSAGRLNARRLAAEVRRLDATRPVTEAIVYLPGYTKKKFEEYEPHLAALDVDGYNYFLDRKSIFFQRDSTTARRFDTEHAKHPQKAFMETEYVPMAALENYDKAEKDPSFLGGFKWTAIDYIGEAGIGRSLVVPQAKVMPTGLLGIGMFYINTWPVFNAYCGDLDLIGNPKAAAYYQAVVWRTSPIELLVHTPLPNGMKEAVAPWGFPDFVKSWSWPGQEGKKMQVQVYTRSKLVKLELNGQVIAQQAVPAGTITATFEIDYQPGTLVAKGYEGTKETGASSLATAGKPVAVRLVADRRTIGASRNDLAYVSVEIVDAKGAVVPAVDDLEVTFEVAGNATIAGVGNGSYNDMSSFQQPRKKVYQGRGLVIVRPQGAPGTILLKAHANGLTAGSVEIVTK